MQNSVILHLDFVFKKSQNSESEFGNSGLPIPTSTSVMESELLIFQLQFLNPLIPLELESEWKSAGIKGFRILHTPSSKYQNYYQTYF